MTEHALACGLTMGFIDHEEHARIQGMIKILFKHRLIKEAESFGAELYEWADRLEWVDGEWYLAVRCGACETAFSFSKESELTERFYFTDSGEIVLGCPDCKMPLAYSGDKVIRIQANG